MVPEFYLKRRDLSEAMKKIGFNEPKDRYFIHPESEHIVEFPPGPLSVGREAVKEIIEIEYSTGVLRIISATDCVKDRLAAFYHWGDKQGLVQALLVSQSNEIDLEEVKRWSGVEGSLDKYIELENHLSGGIEEIY